MTWWWVLIRGQLSSEAKGKIKKPKEVERGSFEIFLEEVPRPREISSGLALLVFGSWWVLKLNKVKMERLIKETVFGTLL